MRIYSLFTSIALFTFSCSNINSDNSNDLIARAGENFLYQNELPSFSSQQDSLLRYKNFVELWAKEKLLYDLSLTNLSQSKKNELDLLIEKFKIDPKETLYIEDIAKNLSIGKERGTTTVWLINDEYWGKKESDKEYIDYKIENLSLFLKEIRLLKNS